MAEQAERKKLVIIILSQPELVEELLTGFLDIGVPGATVLESQGMGSIIKKEMPIFAGMASLFSEQTGSRMIMSVMPESVIETLFELVEEVVGQIDQENSAMCVTLPVDEFRGIRRSK